MYYSQTQDWEFPDGAGRKWDPSQKGDFRNYIDTKSLPQLKEILTKYDPAIIWFDTPHATDAALAREFEQLVRSISPDTIINSRVLYHGNQVEGLRQEQLDELVDIGVDFLSYRDRTIPPKSPWEYWETCMTLNGAWGYNAEDNNWKTPQQVIMQLTEVVSKGGTFLLNVGPTADGVIPEPAVQTLKEAGAWLQVNAESIYGARGTNFEGQGDFITISAADREALEKEALATGAGKAKKGHRQKDYAWLATGRAGKLYLHLFKWPSDPLVLDGFDDEKVTKAYFLADSNRQNIELKQAGGVLTIDLPEQALDPISTVVCLELE
ncbi:alpha-L-fucosidase [Coraliomargarita sp. SDUM461003]|uniref:alpha-L-fucosidase n=1 Tax=Thalassobacterium maritimum TaxID=3041265 RepID=A0ABU1AT89_9BACT|nr:alpha-L-fucosidase [Coraliomargarita sp. SDUM461003]MDQ8207386.1 alpha-L-fucosidase [Coraliomargarita sp. SDUM461003]